MRYLKIIINLNEMKIFKKKTSFEKKAECFNKKNCFKLSNYHLLSSLDLIAAIRQSALREDEIRAI